MTKFYLIRHAEAEGNLYRRIHGHYDSKITPRGYEQISLLSRRFQDLPIDAVYASDLQRTQITAQSVLERRALPLRIDPRLKEVGMGVWEDLPWGNAMHDDLQQMVYFGADPERWSIPGSEPFVNLRSRIHEVICELGEKHKGQTLACFSHGMAIRSLISQIKGLPSQRISEIQHGDNTSVAELTYADGCLQLHSYNDNSHLPPKASTFASQAWWKSGKTEDTSNLRFLPLDPATEGTLYTDCYREAWITIHGSEEGFTPGPYRKGAERSASRHPQALMKALASKDFAGIVELDTDRKKDEGIGWISFCYLAPDFRGSNLGVQLVGHAVSVYRNLGRKCLRLHVSAENKNAISFYQKLGFVRLGTDEGVRAPLLLMELAL